MREVFFQDVQIGQKFCFTYLNHEREDLWFTKVSEGEYQDKEGVKDLENGGGSRYSTRVWIK